MSKGTGPTNRSLNEAIVSVPCVNLAIQDKKLIAFHFSSSSTIPRKANYSPDKDSREKERRNK